MKRFAASLMVCIFVVGMLVLPAVHRLHCDCHEHHAAGCPICQLAGAPLDVASSHVAIVCAEPMTLARRVAPLAVIVTVPLCGATQPRAPPTIA